MEIVNEYIVIDVLRAQLKRSGYSFPLSVHKSLSEIVDFFLHLKAIFMDFIRTSISVGHLLLTSLPAVYGLITD